MKRFTHCLFFAIATLLVAVGCDNPVKDDVQGKEDTLKLTPSELIFAAEGGAESVSLEASGAWSAVAESEADWCALSAMEGTEGREIVVTVAPNEGELRSVNYLFTLGELSTKLTVAQAANEVGGGVFAALEELYNVPAEGYTITLPVELSEGLTWEYNPEHEWLHLWEGSEDAENAGLVLMVDENIEATPRECDVLFTLGEESKSVKVVQEGAKPYVSASPESFELTYKEQTITLFISYNTEYEVTYGEGCDWIAFDKEDYNGTHFMVSANPNTTERTGEIIFSVSGSDQRSVVTVTQAGRPDRPASPPNNQIWYSTKHSGQTSYVYNNTSFDRTIVEHTYDWDEQLGIITFDGDVTEVRQEGWWYDDRTVKIILPESVTKVGTKAFYKCVALKEIVAPGLQEIGESAFAECSELKSFDFSGPIASLPTRCFEKSGLEEVTIPGGIKTIGDYAFTECDLLKTVTLAEGVGEVKYGTFFGCDKLENIHFSSTVKIIGEWAFGFTYGLKTIEWGGVEKIGRSAFCGSGLERLELSANINEMADEAFASSNNLKEVVVASQVLGTNALAFCSALTSVEILPTCLSLELNCFYNCTALQSITIPGHIKTIPEQAFMYCSLLENVTLEEGVESIDTRAFQSCLALKEFVCPSSLRVIGVTAFSDTSLESIAMNEGLETIDELAFLSTQMVDFDIPATVKEIGDGAFSSNVAKSATFHGPIPARKNDATIWVSRWCSNFTAYVPAEYYEEYAAIAIGTEANGYNWLFGSDSSLVAY
ncbi:MAG: leucine-rich repeat protein [Tidjanibacter sp.]|nr:leucine-rich repeat protein [Tidjanibacter sp.]